MDTTSRGTSDEPEGINPPAAPAALELAQNYATTVAKLPPVGSYADLWSALRQKHGLPPTLTPDDALQAAAILLRGQAPRGVIKMRRGSQYRVGETTERAGTTTISGSSSLISSLLSDKAA